MPINLLFKQFFPVHFLVNQLEKLDDVGIVIFVKSH